jgi:hypothetical protein
MLPASVELLLEILAQTPQCYCVGGIEEGRVPDLLEKL